MGLRRSQVHPPAQSTETPEIRPGHLMCLWTVLKSSNRWIDTKRKKQQMKTLTPLLHSLLLLRYNFLLTQVFFQFNSLNLLLCLYAPLSCSEQSRGLKREHCTETEMSGTSHLRQSCTWNVEPFVKKAVDSCRATESKWWPGVQNGASCRGWSSPRTHSTATRTMHWQHSKETTLKDLPQPDSKQEKTQNNRKTQFQSKTQKNKNVRVK